MTVLDGRLLAAADFVTAGAYVVDVGTDHGHLPVFLVERGLAQRALASDVNPQPLASAQRNIAASGLEGQICTQLADGLDGIDLEGVTDLVIAGMGGMLIADILEKRLPLTGVNLILQPMTQAPYLRRWLCGHGIRILAETPAEAAGKMYTVINARTGFEPWECEDLFAHVGRIPETIHDLEKRPAAEKYLRNLRKKLEVIALGLHQSGRDPESTARYQKLIGQIRSIEEGAR